MGQKKKRRVQDDSKVFGLSNGKDRVATYEGGLGKVPGWKEIGSVLDR